jgi:inner membrane protein
MEPVTQGLLGAAFGQALCGKSLGKRALTWGAFAGMLPDVDVVMNWTGPMGEFLYHRSFTHSVWCGPLVGPVLGWLAWRWAGRETGRLRAWIVLFVVGILTHPLLDAFTSYGTQLLSPLSDRRFAWDGVAIVDPAYSLILALGIAWGLWRGVASSTSRVAAVVALALSTAYLVYGVVLNERLEARVRRDLVGSQVRGGDTADVRAYPTLLQLFLRRVVVRVGDEVRVGWVSTWRDNGGRWEWFRAPVDPRIDAARATREGRILEWFADGVTTGRVVEAGSGRAFVEIDDLRYGFPGRPQDGLWGIRVPLDDAGRPAGPAERFNRPLPPASGETLRFLFREAFLN